MQSISVSCLPGLFFVFLTHLNVPSSCNSVIVGLEIKGKRERVCE